MIDYILKFQWNGLMGICLYWVPLLFCAFGYTVRTATNYMKDKEARDAEGFYYPTDRIGDLIGRVFVTLCPIANLWAAMFDVAPSVFSKLFTWIGNVFDAPLVPKRKP